MNERNPLLRFWSIVSVSAYLITVGAYLIFTGRIRPPVSLWKIFRALWYPRYRGSLENITHENGYCFVAPVPEHIISDKEGFSKIVVFEDGQPLPHAHASHEFIRTRGEGGFSHWGTDLYFSASDNSDPSANGRTYTVREIKVK